MKITNTLQRPDGTKKLTIELGVGETLIAIAPDAHYRMGQPVDDVVASHILAETARVTWCSASQEWVA